jgi:hypothetical protein
VINEGERMWKEVVVAKLKALPWHLSGATEEEHGKPVGIVAVPAETQTGLQNTRRKRYRLGQLVRCPSELTGTYVPDWTVS